MVNFEELFELWYKIYNLRSSEAERQEYRAWVNLLHGTPFWEDFFKYWKEQRRKRVGF